MSGFTNITIVHPIDPSRPGIGVNEVKLTVCLTEPADQEFFVLLVPLAESVEALAVWLRERRTTPTKPDDDETDTTTAEAEQMWTEGVYVEVADSPVILRINTQSTARRTTPTTQEQA